ncbi:MAG: protein kinase [Planctomycetia bacterium]|nr:protein kinase [Planctomycetia bacterium]
MVGKDFGDFEIKEEIGKGGMGRVYRAIQKSLNREVAIKVLSAALSNNDEFVERFDLEAKSVAKLMQTNIIQMYSKGVTEDGTNYFAMEYVHGEDLSSKIKRGDKFSEKEVVDIIIQACRGLEEAKKYGIIHRDIKPSNILITNDGVVKIADFGLAKSLEATMKLTRTDVFMGTVNYTSPEQGLGKPLDHRTDIYSLGIVFYQLLTNKLPFDAESAASVIYKHVHEEPEKPRKINPKISSQAEAIILKAIAKKPEDRYQDITEFRQALEAVLDTKSTEIAKKKKRFSYVTIAVSIVLVIGGIVMYFLLISSTESQRVIKLIAEADSIGEKHDYKKCLEKLKSAYNLCSSEEIADKIVERYFQYSIGSIAWAMSSKSDLLKDKTVSVIPFAKLNGDKSEQGKIVASELINQLKNFDKVKAYEREFPSDVLKEIQLIESGVIHDDTRQKLRQLVETEGVVVGWIGYVENTFKISARMLHVESGKILGSESVDILGWNINDTVNNAEFNVKIRMDSKTYSIGDPATIYLTASRDCYITLFNVRSNGEIWELFPNRYKPDNFVQASVEYKIPGTNDSFGFRICEPPGKEYIKVIASTIPLSPNQIQEQISHDTTFLVAKADNIAQNDNYVFRSVSPTEMRGLHEILKKRAIEVVPSQKSKKVSYDEPNLQLDYAVSSWSFETIKLRY